MEMWKSASFRKMYDTIMTISVSKELLESLRKRFLPHLEVRVLLQRRLLIPPVKQARRETAVPEATTTAQVQTTVQLAVMAGVLAG